MRRKPLIAIMLLVAVFVSTAYAEIVVSSDGDLSVDVSPRDGSLAMDLLGSIWTLPATGGMASRLTDSIAHSSHPRWSPDGTRIAYTVDTANGGEAWLVEVAGGTTKRVVDNRFHVQDVAWHPDAQRLLYASDRDGDGLDIRETDLPTGLSWRLTDLPGDEFAPAWSANGRHLTYIHKLGTKYILMLRRHGETDLALTISDTPLSSPSWRPDGSLITYLRHNGQQWTLQMAILSTPVLIRPMHEVADVFTAPVSWPSRMQMTFAADGKILTRDFEDRRSRPIHFRAIVADAPTTPQFVARRSLELVDPSAERLVIRGQRLFDGIWSGYRRQMDVLIGDGKIIAVEPRREWQDATVLDLGDVAVIPGLIDTWSALPDTINPRVGAALLAYGVTTVVSTDTTGEFEPLAWESADTPGPRFLPAGIVGDRQAIEPANDYFLVQLRTSNASAADIAAIIRRWHDAGVPVVATNSANGRVPAVDVYLGTSTAIGTPTFTSDRSPRSFISGLADATTPGIEDLLRSRQAIALDQTTAPRRRVSRISSLATTGAFVAAGSRPNGLPPGLALHAELRALAAAGMNGEEALHTAGRNAALLLGLENQVGTLIPGAFADMVLINGDPLQEPGDAQRIVAVIRNGRFFSLVNLLERAGQTTTVE